MVSRATVDRDVTGINIAVVDVAFQAMGDRRFLQPQKIPGCFPGVFAAAEFNDKANINQNNTKAGKTGERPLQRRNGSESHDTYTVSPFFPTMESSNARLSMKLARYHKNSARKKTPGAEIVS